MSSALLLAKRYFGQFDGTPFEVEISTGESFTVGSGSPKFKIIFKKPVSPLKVARSGTLTLGEAYMDGDLEIEGDLTEVLDHFLGYPAIFDSDTNFFKKLLFSPTDEANQKDEVCYHYDLGNEFYGMWLGETMNYSCAYFKDETKSLDEAQRDKNTYILKKLNISPGMTLLDIGCGWGSLIVDAVKRFGAECVGITLSEEQYEGCKEVFAQTKLGDRARVCRMDYREIAELGQEFDRVVSVGMLEHVGRENYPLFLDSINTVLKKRGLMLLHYISSLSEYPGNPWIKKYIFPGGVIPSLREIIYLAGDRDMYALDVESLRRHYARTLMCWHDSFKKKAESIKSMFGERFVRMWELYLCGCAASFKNGVVDLHQILFSKGINNEIPMTRDHLFMP